MPNPVPPELSPRGWKEYLAGVIVILILTGLALYLRG